MKFICKVLSFIKGGVQPETQKVADPEPYRQAAVRKCPYCDYQLDKPPGRKKKCPNCQNFMFVRTSPTNNVKVVVTEAQADEIDLEWAKIGGTYDEVMENRRSFEKEKEKLKQDWGADPSDNDVEWHLLMQERLTHASNEMWGFYRNTTLSMAENAKKSNKIIESLMLYWEVCYLDLNGPVNVGINKNGRPKSNPFKPEKPYSMIAPGIMSRIKKLASKNKITDEKLKEYYFQSAQQVHESLQLPCSPEVVWEMIQKYENEGQSN